MSQECPPPSSCIQVQTICLLRSWLCSLAPGPFQVTAGSELKSPETFFSNGQYVCATPCPPAELLLVPPGQLHEPLTWAAVLSVLFLGLSWTPQMRDGGMTLLPSSWFQEWLTWPQPWVKVAHIPVQDSWRTKGTPYFFLRAQNIVGCSSSASSQSLSSSCFPSFILSSSN